MNELIGVRTTVFQVFPTQASGADWLRVVLIVAPAALLSQSKARTSLFVGGLIMETSLAIMKQTFLQPGKVLTIIAGATEKSSQPSDPSKQMEQSRSGRAELCSEGSQHPASQGTAP